MKLVKIAALVAATALAGCTQAPAEEVDAPDVPLAPACIAPCIQFPVTPPSLNDWPITLDTYAEVGDEVWLDSLTTVQYPQYWVIEVDGLGPVPHETAYAEPTDDVAQDPCTRTIMEGTLYGESATSGYWYVIGTRSKPGGWIPASGSTPAHCDLRISWSIPGGYSAVRISARARTSWAGSYYERQITEGAYWYN